jgi:hypothetical protein
LQKERGVPGSILASVSGLVGGRPGPRGGQIGTAAVSTPRYLPNSRRNSERFSVYLILTCVH